MADTLGPTQVRLGASPDGTPMAWDWYRDPNVLVGGAAGWGKTFTVKGLLRGIEPATKQGKEGGLLVWNPKRLGYYDFRDRLLYPEWKSDFRLSNVYDLWRLRFSPFLWETYIHRMTEIERLESQGIDEFRGAGYAPLVVVMEEFQGLFQVLEALPTPKGERKPADVVAADLNVMSALFRASGIRLILVSQAMTAEGGIPTKTKTNCTARLWVGPIDDGGYKACFGQNIPQDFPKKYRPTLGSGIFQCPDTGTRGVQIAF